MKFSSPKAFTIQRSQWLRGLGKDTRLLDEDGKRDCFGFLFQAAGVPDTELIRKDEPGDIARVHDWDDKRLIKYGTVGFHQTSLCDDIINVNDVSLLHDKLREVALIKFFQKADIQLSFAD